VADGLLAALLRVLTEAEAGLAQVGSAPPWNMPDPAFGATAVLLRPAGVETKPASVLVYVPVLPVATSLDDSPFQNAERIEFRDKDYARAESALRNLATTADPRVKTEALLRLARVQTKRGNASQALDTYSQLWAEDRLSSAEVPYAVLARFERCKLLAAAGRHEPLDRESADLLSALDSGRWPLRKDAYAYYRSELHRFARSSSSRVPDTKLAVSEAVHALWEEWESGGRRQLRPGRRIARSGNSRTLILVNSTPDRIAALVYADDAIRRLVAGAGWDRSMLDGTSGSLLDEQGERVFGSLPRSGEIQASRSLAGAQIPWQIRLSSSIEESSRGLVAGQRQYLIWGLAVISGIVALACYAMARGVIRELDAARLQSDFVSAVSHEFRSPLTTLRQLTELLASGRIHDEARRRVYFDFLQKETGRLHSLVENLLDFGRMEAGRRQYRPEPSDLHELVREVVCEYQEEISGSGYAFELAGSAAPVRADREAIRRLVRNLLENAVKYSPECRTVWIETGLENGRAVLRVRDRGMGIAPQEQARVFDRFVRGQAAKEACIQGTGIGLAMVREIVKAHAGDVHLASELGRGSTFTVCLPLGGAANGSAQ
jgi:signal transduction histidine kinase